MGGRRRPAAAEGAALRRSSSMTAPWLVIQHVPWEGPGSIATIARNRGIALETVSAGKTALEPSEVLERFSGLIVMGGPMSVNDTAEHTYLDQERSLLAAAVARGRPVLGVCLGAQLLAAALGARVFPGPEPEIGFAPVRLTEEGRRDPVLGGAETIPAFHWHGETFELPKGAVLLGSTAAYPHQAFRIGSSAYGLQFHLELDAELLEAWRPHLPDGTPLGEPDRLAVERAGHLVFERFFRTVG
ncbi:MAG: type 1 glutamine amidotransferase [Acidobacteria bacterium]|nr:MAG: type 1 glutamine amidotransferase [Acidobacteriota bacterium]